jgi:hypothetical protein
MYYPDSLLYSRIIEEDHTSHKKSISNLKITINKAPYWTYEHTPNTQLLLSLMLNF